MSDITIELIPPGARIKYHALRDRKAFRESFSEIGKTTGPIDIVAYALSKNKVVGFAILKQDGKIKIVVHPQYESPTLRARLREVVMGKLENRWN